MATRVQLWDLDDDGKPRLNAVYFLKPDGTVDVEAEDEGLRRYALKLVEGGIRTVHGTFDLRSGQAFLDNLHHRFQHSSRTWVRDEDDDS